MDIPNLLIFPDTADPDLCLHCEATGPVPADYPKRGVAQFHKTLFFN